MTLTAPPRLLLVHAHPDDESITTGGTIARYAAHGVQVTLVTCTLGEEGEVIPEGLAELASDGADQLGGYRVSELRSACAALGVVDHRFLGGVGHWRDSGMAGATTNDHPRAFVRGNVEEQAAALTTIIADVLPQVVVSYAADGGYGHPDHIRAHEITMAAAARSPDVARIFHAVNSRKATADGLARLAGAEALPYRLPSVEDLPAVDDDGIDTVVDVGAHVAAKLTALRAHATQVGVWQDGEGTASFALSNGIAQPVPDAEFFVLAHGDGEGAARDLFGGLGLAGADGGHP